jgi:hypothetical protein
MRTAAPLVGVGAILAACLLAASSAGSDSTASTLHLYEHDTSQASIDLGAHGDSEGDQFIFAGDAFDRKGGTMLGRAGGSCTTMSTGAKGEVLCVVNFALRHGEIATQGLLVAADLFGGKKLTYPITGGTGRYRGARGQASVQIPQDVPHLADANFTLRLR